MSFAYRLLSITQYWKKKICDVNVLITSPKCQTCCVQVEHDVGRTKYFGSDGIWFDERYWFDFATALLTFDMHRTNKFVYINSHWHLVYTCNMLELESFRILYHKFETFDENDKFCYQWLHCHLEMFQSIPLKHKSNDKCHCVWVWGSAASVGCVCSCRASVCMWGCVCWDARVCVTEM